MQRLAEVRLAQGRRDEARELLDEALLLARWSTIGMHLLQRIFGTLIVSAPDPASARAMVDRAEATLGEPDQCWFCTVMLAVPAATACARVGDLDDAHRFLDVGRAIGVALGGELVAGRRARGARPPWRWRTATPTPTAGSAARRPTPMPPSVTRRTPPAAWRPLSPTDAGRLAEGRGRNRPAGRKEQRKASPSRSSHDHQRPHHRPAGHAPAHLHLSTGRDSSRRTSWSSAAATTSSTA